MFKDFTGSDKVYIACGYTDIRKCIDGLATLVQSEFKLTEVTHIGCFAHLRRKFFEAMDASCDNTVAKKGFDYCEALFAIEKELADKTPEERYEARQKYSVPILNEFKHWADAQRVPAKSKTGKALT